MIEGLSVAITPRAAIAFGLIAHELATNAVKYGALSRPGGHVTVRAVGRSEADGAFVLEWRKSGGRRSRPRSARIRTHGDHAEPPVSGGGAELDFDPSGLGLPRFHSSGGSLLRPVRQAQLTWPVPVMSATASAPAGMRSGRTDRKHHNALIDRGKFSLLNSKENFGDPRFARFQRLSISVGLFSSEFSAKAASPACQKDRQRW